MGMFKKKKSEQLNVPKKRKKLSTSALVLVISCIIIAIPVIIFLVIIISASVKTGKPIHGNRFNNDLNPSISNSQQSAIVREVESISEVDSCEVVLTSAQLRVNVDVNDSISEIKAGELAEEVYTVVNKNLPIATYFTISSDGSKMYDLAINVYNYVPENNEDENWISYLITKNSKMETSKTQLISKPINPELAKELRNPTVDDTQNQDDTVTK